MARFADAALRQCLTDKLDVEVDNLNAALLVDFVETEFWPTIHNQDVADARGLLDERLADLGSVCHYAEFRPTRVSRGSTSLQPTLLWSPDASACCGRSGNSRLHRRARSPIVCTNHR